MATISHSLPRHPHEPDWNIWQPKEKAVLCFVTRDHQILLIHKKRGFGAGKVNGPGGRIDPGETALQAAIRETQEEVGITPYEPEWMGELFFQFLDGYSLHCSVFHAKNHSGELLHTDEADPFWCPIDQIPFERMWADDVQWLPLMLQGQKFHGYFTFNGEVIVAQRIDKKSQC